MESWRVRRTRISPGPKTGQTDKPSLQAGAGWGSSVDVILARGPPCSWALLMTQAKNTAGGSGAPAFKLSSSGRGLRPATNIKPVGM